MATKSKLEQAVERYAGKLNDAQGELVKTQLATYKRGQEQLARISEELRAVNAMSATTFRQVRAKQAQRATLLYEHNQVATANAEIAAGLSEMLGDQE